MDKRAVHIHMEGVPNPRAVKFVLENGILSEQAYEFDDLAQAALSPLAEKLLMLRYVERVLIHQNFVTINKTEEAPEWEEVLSGLMAIIREHLEADQPILFLGVEALSHARSDEVVAEMVSQLLDQYIRPAAAQDGGDILFESYKDGVLQLRMHGACHQCPYIRQTIDQGVMPLLRQALPEIREIRDL